MFKFIILGFFFSSYCWSDQNTLNNNLLRAAQQNRIADIEQQLKNGADPNYHLSNGRDYSGPTSLVFAASNCSLKATQILLRANANVHYVIQQPLSRIHLMPALSFAAYSSLFNNECPDVIKLLLSHGSNPLDRAANGYLALHWSLLEPSTHMEPFRELLGATSYTLNDLSLAALFLVTNLENEKLAMVLALNADLYNYPTPSLKRPLLQVALNPAESNNLDRHEKIVEILLSGGARVENSFYFAVKNPPLLRLIFFRKLLSHRLLPQLNEVKEVLDILLRERRYGESAKDIAHEAFQLLAGRVEQTNTLIYYLIAQGAVADDDVDILFRLLQYPNFSPAGDEVKKAFCLAQQRQLTKMHQALVSAGVLEECL